MSENNQGIKPKRQITVTVEGGQTKTFDVNVHSCKECRTEIWWRVEGKKQNGQDKWVAHTFEAGYPEHNHWKDKKKFFPKKAKLTFWTNIPGSGIAEEDRKMVASFLTSNSNMALSEDKCFTPDNKPIYVFEEREK